MVYIPHTYMPAIRAGLLRFKQLGCVVDWHRFQASLFKIRLKITQASWVCGDLIRVTRRFLFRITLSYAPAGSL